MTRNKYHAVKANCDQGGTPHWHDSKAERARCWVLHQRQAAGEITGLQRQPRFPLAVYQVAVGTYVADFRYVDLRTRQEVVEDVKGVRTPVYKLKRKLMQACYGITVQEVD